MGPRVLQLLGPSSGGIRRHVATLGNMLGDFGIPTSVAGPLGVMDSIYEGASVVEVTDSPHPKRVLGAVRQVRELGHYEIIHAHGLKAGLVALLAKREQKVVLTIHNVVLDAPASAKQKFLNWLERQIVSRSDFVIAVSPEILERFSGEVRPNASRFVLPASPAPEPTKNREPARAELGFSENTFVVVVVARLHKQKDLPTFLRAWAEVSKRVPQGSIRALIVGDGPDKESLTKLRSDLGLEESVSLFGNSPYAVDQLNAADLMALSSVWEGAPLVVCEAMQLGLPIVSTDVGVIAQMVGDEGGRIVKVGDHRGLASAIVEIIESPDLARKMSVRNAEVGASLYGAEPLVSQVSEIYREVVSHV